MEKVSMDVPGAPARRGPGHEPLPEDQALRLVVEGTVSETGTAFFRALVRNLAQALNTAGAWVTEYLPASCRLRANAFWIDGRFVEGYEYALAGTPCAPVIASKCLIHIPENIVKLYPQDPDLQRFHAVSYMGVPLLDTDGTVLGHLAVLDTKPMPKQTRLVSLFEIFAARAGAEHRRLRAEQQMLAREEQLALLLQTAMDAILLLDVEGRIQRVNPAAERLFGCTAEDLLAEDARDFFDRESAQRLEVYTRELTMRPEGRKNLWIPQSFTARRWDNTTFPAEATLSCFARGKETFYTLILRNIDERIEAERQIRLLTEETEYLRAHARNAAGVGDLLGASPGMLHLFESIRQVAATEATVLILGETGTGKELITRAIHNGSPRREKPLVRVNCAAIPATLMESEFFGHERGAFTGATCRREGRFALADHGTIFLDEIGELPLDLQAKLLRVLQEGEFEPLGSTQIRRVDVRVIAATNRHLKDLVAAGKFREDLYYRLNVFPLEVPALRNRGQDIGLLANAFVERFARRIGRRLEPLTPEDHRRLQAYAWPGNVRELQNVIERAIILSPGTRLDLARAMPEPATPAPPSTETQPSERILTAQEMAACERANIEQALKACGWKIAGKQGAAHLLGVPASTLSSRMKALQIRRPPSHSTEANACSDGALVKSRESASRNFATRESSR